MSKYEQLKVNTSRVSTDNTSVESNIKDMKAKLTEITAAIEKLNQMWEGDAKEAFTTAYNADLKKVGSIFSEMDSLKTSIDSAKAAYESAEKQVETLVSEWQY